MISERSEPTFGVTCPDCGGAGEGECIGGEWDERSYQRCHRCDGTGRVSKPEASGEPEDYPEREDDEA